uniref:OPA3-like protein n=1 Tax=Polytomella parva TaxID=51329 RepID=A0A7S0YP67_9CHLO|mmetsp:Transcript_30796/g.56052  ORF Transcript_30796/g.56052 Transcript_30796/m.56052 type:complete len:189 (+) Transcript_30796:128-694(+)|eukprot:CAMPEP_0175061096 /NCGR_PEP_ID=MMETSP0052_2-20121109/13397_1 /TAXON_ID=51329 ORGANISM="Polytomella parva, Strain SAG 63-3" /NCGR_SAMPLE_ID=MMETSP0052_2 /ASSEMBLY_ACC=CAM_ASM_000194 /LENGTH=188 /DNA_ID=CAMNT_0016326917 /DNA_START=63 /DNA_END=629 /DNA_ORIENTATION=-
MALVFKVGTLVLKTLAKPIGASFQGWAMQHPLARSYIINTAQLLHKAEIFITRGAEGKTGKAFVGNMSDEKSLELASKVASEGFVFSLMLVLLTAEYQRSRKSEEAKKAKQKEEKETVLNLIEKNYTTTLGRLEIQDEAIKTLNASVQSLEARLAAISEEHSRLQETMEQEKIRRSHGLFGGFFSVRA